MEYMVEGGWSTWERWGVKNEAGRKVDTYKFEQGLPLVTGSKNIKTVRKIFFRELKTIGSFGRMDL